MGLVESIPEDVEGTSYAPLLTGGNVVRPASQLYFMINGQFSKRKVPSDVWANPVLGERGVRTQRYTLYINKFSPDSTLIHLWDRKEDPYQLENIAPDNPDLVEKLIREELHPWLRKTNDPWMDE
jgi:arylsulfatase A-like enzyme